MSFHSSQDLITHVNTTHLHLPIERKGVVFSQDLFLHSQPSLGRVGSRAATPCQELNSISCLWNDCDLYPTSSDVPGPSTGNATEAALELLGSHLLHDHLGISLPYSPTPDDCDPTSIILDGEQRLSDATLPSPRSAFASTSIFGSPPAPLQPATVTLASEPTQPIVCMWQPCSEAQTVFASAADLTAHITDVHVGAGNSRYHCMWEGCNRHGEAGFSSKQKILRHIQVILPRVRLSMINRTYLAPMIQSHTGELIPGGRDGLPIHNLSLAGHRPFQCKICKQYFSEAATLQQHMRRHTKESTSIRHCSFPSPFQNSWNDTERIGLRTLYM